MTTAVRTPNPEQAAAIAATVYTGLAQLPIG